jgi:hypothetical protein
MRSDQPDADVPDVPRAVTHRSPRADGAASGDSPASGDGAGSGDGAAPAAGAAAPASRAGQLAEHARLRASVAAGDRAAAGRTGWTDAVPGLRAEWAQHKERYPDRPQAAPRTEPDGSWLCGEHRRLDPEQNTEASKAHADLADEARRDILPAMRRVEAAGPDRKLAGLEHMVKGEDRFKEKLADYLRVPGVTVAEAVDEIADVIRSTFCYTADRYSRGVLTDVDQLKSEGFELIKLKNLWDADQYKGINSQWRVPETGSRFEMQFHTPESLEAKELTHEAYERIRAGTVAPAEQRDLEDFQRRVNGLVAIPPGTDQIRDFPEKNDGSKDHLLRSH